MDKYGVKWLQKCIILAIKVMFTNYTKVWRVGKKQKTSNNKNKEMHMQSMYRLKRRVRSAMIATAAVSMVLANIASVSAASLSSASLTLSDPRSSQTGVDYDFTATGFSANAACITLRLNTQADGGGSAVGTTTAATLDAGSDLITPANWTEDVTVNGTLEITHDSADELPVDGNTLTFNNITNGATEGTTYFGLLNTYGNTDCSTSPLDDVVVAYIFKDGEPVSLTIDPTLTFVCNGITADTIEAINGEVITHDSNASGIDYLNDVTSSTNGVSAHDLDVSTNANSGYRVLIRHTGQLTNAGGDTIDNWTGTNGSPTTFTAAGTEAWGYSTEDSTLDAVGDGVDRFTNPGNEWAGFSTTDGVVIENTGATSGTETTRVGHQVAVASDTEAGTYTTTILYTVVATF